MKKHLIITFILSFFIFYLFINSKEAYLITNENINLFLNTLLPNLFPYMLLVLLFISFNCHLILAYLVQYISIPLFNISGKAFSILLIGIIGGYPLLAILAKEIINKDNEKELNKLVPLFSFPSLAFLNNIIKPNIGFNPIFSLLIISFLLLLIFKDKEKKEYLNYNSLKYSLKDNLSFNCFTNSIFKVLTNLGLIFSNLLFFSLFKVLLTFNNEKINYFALSFFEFSKSSIYFSLNINNKIDYILLTYSLLFGGLSILMQIYTIYNGSLLSIKTYLKYRLYLIIIILLFIYIY